MGLFNRKSMQERQADAARMAEDIAEGRGFMGRMTKAFMGSEFTDSMKQGMAALNAPEQFAALVASGVPVEIATVVSVQDTGMTINDNPSVVLVVDHDGRQQALTTLVSRLEIPRGGDRVRLARDPQTTQLLYGGLA